MKFMLPFMRKLCLPFISWIFLFVLIYFTSPTGIIILLFFFLLFFCLFFTFLIFFQNFRHPLIIAAGIIVFLILRYLQIGNFITFFLILGIVITIEIYFWYTKPNAKQISRKAIRKKSRARPS